MEGEVDLTGHSGNFADLAADSCSFSPRQYQEEGSDGTPRLFRFDYKDIFKVNQIRRSGEFVPVAVAGFADASQWEKLKQREDRVIQRAIDNALGNTSVTVVCVGERTASRRWVKYELRASQARGNGLLGVYLPGESGHQKPIGLADAPLYRWNSERFADWVEAAYLRSR